MAETTPIGIRDDARLSAIVERFPDAIFCLDARGYLTDVNPAAVAISGYPRERLVGMHFSELLIPSDVEQGLALFARVMACESIHHERLTIVHAEGRDLTLGVSAFPMIADGTVVAITGIARDITDRVQEHAALIASEERYRSLVQLSPDAIVVCGGDYGILFANQAACYLAGVASTEELLSYSVLDLMLPIERESFEIEMLEQVRSGGGTPVTGRLARLDGSGARHVELRGSWVTWDGSEAMQLVIRDVTERRATEEALRATEKLLHELTEHVEDVFYVSDAQGARVLYVSPAFERVWGRSIFSLLEDPGVWWGSIHEADREPAKRDVQTRQPAERRYRILRPDGTLRWIEDRCFPVFGDRGEIVRWAGIAKDVTEHRLLEEQLVHAQKMDSIGRLAGGIAHDFNNLLMVMINAAGFIRDELPETSPLREDVEQILEAADRGAKFVKQLLAYGRRQVVNPKNVDVNDVIAPMRELLQRTIGEDVELLLSLGDVPPARIDPSQLSQIIVNLAANARDAMPKGGTFSIETKPVLVDESFGAVHSLRPGPYVCISASDTGTGIPRDIVDKVFDPFFTTKPMPEATGLGLSMVYGVVTQAGGQISIYTEPGCGTTLKIYLPALEPIDPQRVPSRASLGRPRSVLVVEDDPSVLASTTKMLERSGYRVSSATSARRALEVVQESKEPVDLVLTDVVMPGMSGRELASHLRVLCPDVEIMYMSGYTEELIGRHGILAAGDNYIQKPFTRAELIEKIATVLN